jgi:hypothetical protein
VLFTTEGVCYNGVLFAEPHFGPAVTSELHAGWKGETLLRFWTKEFWAEGRYRPWRIIFFFLVLVFVTELGVRLFFLIPGLVDRNPGSTVSATTYLLEQMSRAKKPKLVFIGSSVTQGYGNAPDGKHFPALIAETLRKRRRYQHAQAFNLSSAGNRYGDHFANLIASMPNKPDLIVTAIHIKMFSVHASLLEPLAHRENIYYFRNQPEYWRGGEHDLFTRFRFNSPQGQGEYREIFLDHKVGDLAGLYRYRRLLGYFLTGNFRFPGAAAAERLKGELGMLDQLMMEAHDTTHEERNADYLWKVIPKHVVQLQYMQCEAFDFSEENINFLTFRDYAEFGREHNIPMLFFLNPINKSFVDDKDFFDWDEVVPIFRERTKAIVLENGHRFVDMTDRIDPRFFSDLDHVNMNGHAQMARLMMPHVMAGLRMKRK